MSLSLNFPDQTYTSSNKPSVVTLKNDLTAIETTVNANETAMVTLTGSEVLTNKTLTAPVITTPTIRTWDGWNSVADTWTYASASTITVPSGAASLYQVGDKIKFTQTTAKYAVISAVADTLLTIIVNTDYVVANAAITSPCVSRMENPFGWPSSFAYTPTGPTGATITGRYRTYGRSIEVNIKGVASGAMNWTNMPTLPVAVSASYIANGVDASPSLGVGGYLDSGTANVVDGLRVTLLASDTTARFCGANTSAVVSATSPITWANNDTFMVRFMYEF